MATDRDDAATSAGSDLAAQAATAHVPVMLERILDLLTPALDRDPAAPGQRLVHVDGTTGMGGHAEAVLERFGRVHLIGIDRDPQALELAGARLERFAERLDLVQAVYSELPRVLDDLGLSGIDSMLLDLGLSSLQIDRRERGFSYSTDAPLDMRMGPDTALTAAEVVNTYEAADLARVLRTYGEEKFADRIVQRIVAAREQEPFERSARLVEVISEAIPMAVRSKQSGHPAKKSFQALRIEVNAELAALDAVLPAALAALNVGGRLAVLAYHSLEDRRVKDLFREASTDNAPRHLPVVPDHLLAQFRLVTRGAEKPGPDEVTLNPRAASARLRVIERVREAA
ncbi:16S rRNA (cytosine(1402)-N(4))-methyltransferase RsmH [Propionibacteriaceae bacterium Y1923]|uniref:16S rRNA (cytosine(1402)-N(4))-methyltransferase RsmH n=1 Tax=Aestuariimicrobium sp. Y1814 TaxID=3418742 RepID=UPI003C2540F2